MLPNGTKCKRTRSCAGNYSPFRGLLLVFVVDMPSEKPELPHLACQQQLMGQIRKELKPHRDLTAQKH